MEPKKFDTLVLGGGGAKCIATLGALQYLYDNSCVADVKKYIGTSAGSMIGLLLAVGYTPIEIIVHTCIQRIPESFLPIDFMALIHGRGAIPFEKIESQLRAMLKEKTGRDKFTLSEIRTEFAKTLIACTYNMTTNKCEYLSPDTHPDLDVVTAVRMSSSLPIVFDECVHGGCVYLDGGLADNFPIVAADESDCVFGCAIFTVYDKLCAQNKLLGLIRILTTVSANFYIDRIISKFSDTHSILRIKLENVGTLDFDQTPTIQLDLFSTGYNCCKAFFKSSKINETDCAVVASDIV